MPAPLTPEQRSEILARFEAGQSKASIAKAMGLNPGTISIHTPPTNPKLTAVEIAEMVRLVESGMTRTEVGARFNRDGETVGKYTRHLKAKTWNETPEDLRADVISRLHAGETTNSIVRTLKISQTTVRKIKLKAFAEYKLSEDQIDAAKKLRAEGKTYYQIAEALQVPITEVFDLYGFRSGLRYSEEDRAIAAKAIASGKTYAQVSQETGASPATIHEWFEAALARGDVERPKGVLEKRDDHKFMWIMRRSPELEEWRQLIVEWYESEKPSANSAIAAVSAFIDKYIIALGLPKKPEELLQRGRTLPDFYQSACPESQAGRDYAGKIFRLIERILDSPRFADTESGEAIRVVDLYRNPIRLVSGYGDTPSLSESNKVVLPYFLIADLRQQIVQGENFTDWKWVQGLGGNETLNGQARAGDWFPIEADQIDRNDLDCVWRLRQRELNSPVLEMWSPVRWVHALIHLQMTSRGGQLRMVDSGEADTYVWQGGQFQLNTGPLRIGTTRKPRQQGIFRSPSPEDVVQGAKVMLYFNSNKTLDKGRAGNRKGFECPWPQMPNLAEDPYYWLEKLRDWQSKYNPIDKLTRWRDLRGHAKLSAMTEEQAAEYPDTAFLFRAPENTENPDWPIFASQCKYAWHKLLSAYEVILAEKGVKHPSGEPIQLINPENGLPWSTQHSTRVSLITHLIMDGDVSPLIMMKIAGHARFIMTIYYTKAGLTGIQNAIRGGTAKLEEMKYQSFERDLLNTKAEHIRQKVVFNAEDWTTVLSPNPADRTPLGWLHLHDGICLAGGNTSGDPVTPGCHNGGPVIRLSSTKKAVHGPVPGGVRNCCRCRWKASGKQHLLGLAASFDNRSYHMHKAGDGAIAAERDRNLLLREKAHVESSNVPFTRGRDLIDAERRHEGAMQRFQELALDVAAIDRTIARVMALPDNIDGPNALAANGDLETLHVVIEDTSSELLQLATICADVELFPDLDAGTAIFEYSQLLDRAFEREGQPMILARLSESEKLVAANAIMRELERLTRPDNIVLARREIVEVLDRGESLKKLLGIDLGNVLQLNSVGGDNLKAVRLI